MSIAVKVWAPLLESEPEGLCHPNTAPKNWFRDEPRHAAELYSLETPDRFKAKTVVHVKDDQDVLHRFEIQVLWLPCATVRAL